MIGLTRAVTTRSNEGAGQRRGAARLMAVGVAALIALGAGCGGDDGPAPLPPSIVSIDAAPDTVLLPLVEATLPLAVTAQLTAGTRDVTSDPATSYLSQDLDVVTVDAPSGTVIARGSGTTRIIVQHAAFADTVVATVDTMAALAVASVSILPESASLGDVGETLDTETTIRWANGARLDRSGPPLVYASDSVEIATVDELGVITAEGIGSTAVRANVGGRGDAVAVTVRPAPTISFGASILPRFTSGPSSCVDAACHPGSGAAQRNLRMNSYDDITAGASAFSPIVVAGEGAGSLLVRVLRGPTGPPFDTAQMPNGKPKFSAAFVDTVQLWIDEGALDN